VFDSEEVFDSEDCDEVDVELAFDWRWWIVGEGEG
jgi:hypothetical protein